jgi:hypothetical protein
MSHTTTGIETALAIVGETEKLTENANETCETGSEIETVTVNATAPARCEMPSASKQNATA